MTIRVRFDSQTITDGGTGATVVGSISACLTKRTSRDGRGGRA
jgi:hypothetical protein